MFYVAYCLQKRCFGKHGWVRLDSEFCRFKLPDRQKTSYPYRCESLEPHRGATVAGMATESNPVCLYKLLETQHCTVSSFSALPHPCFPHLLPSTPLAVLWVPYVCLNIDDPSNSWPWFVELFGLLVPSRVFFFLFNFLVFLSSVSQINLDMINEEKDTRGSPDKTE